MHRISTDVQVAHNLQSQVESISRWAMSPRPPCESESIWLARSQSTFRTGPIVAASSSASHVILWFDDLVYGIPFHVFKLLFRSPWPNDLHAIDSIRITQSEMNDPRRLRQITGSCLHRIRSGGKGSGQRINVRSDSDYIRTQNLRQRRVLRRRCSPHSKPQPPLKAISIRLTKMSFLAF